MGELRHILAVGVFATAAAVVADDQADRSASPAPAEAAHSLPGLAAAARVRSVPADSGRPARPAAATAAAAALEMTRELREPRRESLVVRLPVAPGEPFRKLTMDGAESYTVCGELTDRGEGRLELTVTICHWRTAQVRLTFTTTLPSTPPPTAAGDPLRRDVRHSPSPVQSPAQSPATAVAGPVHPQLGATDRSRPLVVAPDAPRRG